MNDFSTRIAGSDTEYNSAVIKVVGIGGGGVNAVDRMIESGLTDVEFIAVNTDAQSIAKSQATIKVDIGRDVSNGLGAGADPTVGMRAAQENEDILHQVLDGADMVFITAGEGGGTGTGAAPVVADIARGLGALTVGVVTRPFAFEGLQRSRNAEKGIKELRDAVDTLIVIPNDRLLEISSEDLTVIEAYKMADDVLYSGVRGISDLITKPGEVNLDFADVKAIMKDAGTAIMGIGKESGPDRAIKATEAAISSPLLEASINGARGVLLAFNASSGLSMREFAAASKLVQEAVDENANIIIGLTVDDKLGDDLIVTVVAAGFDEPAEGSETPVVAAPAPAIDIPTFSAPAEVTVPVVTGNVASPISPLAESVAPVEFAPEPETRRPDLDIPPFLFEDDE